MSKKKDVQIQITSDAQWREVLKEGGSFLLEAYSEKWGQCKCFNGTVQKLFYAYMDCCKFYAAPVEKVKALNEHECIEPVFLLYKDGKKIETFVGVDGPKIEAAMKLTKP
eukprot:TRINITY_DN4864_c0_g1_i4.p2 TRINITY_DN4864_c0_g1~~TRINITY_DN4864_c0_g1_i4.p2  ORF type:complete len:110 (+),score=38.93 TRINITY_DN4864_c0_g1_i4:188-517(+)